MPAATLLTLLPIAVPAEPAALDALRELDVLVEGGTVLEVHADATAEQIEALGAQGIPWRPLPENPRPALTSAARGAFAYHDTDGVAAALLALAAAHPSWARPFTFGESVLGQPITGLALSDGGGLREADEPTLRLLGGHHGDEWASVEVVLAAAEELLVRADSGEADAVTLLSLHELVVVPLLNPDGHAAYTRTNAAGVDLNRNYAHQWTSAASSGDAPFSEPETAAVAAHGRARAVAWSLSVHSGATNLGWPWNWTTDSTPDDTIFAGAAAAYASLCPQDGFWITQGAHWYTSRGDANDWSYGERSGRDFTLEVSLVKSPPPEEMPAVLEAHVPPLLHFFTHGTRQGLRGLVTDPSGRGLEARVHIVETGASVLTDPESGTFMIPVLPGDWALQVAAPGLPSWTGTVSVPPADEGPATLDLVLPDAGPPAPFRLQVAGPILTITGDLPPDLAVSLVRAPGEPIPVPSVAVAGGLQVDLASLTLAEPWAVEGEWSLLLRRADGSTWSRRSQAVLVPGADPTWSLSAVIPTVLGSGPDRVLALDLWGTSLPRGAELRLVAEDGRRLLPLPEPQADGEDHIVRRFAITDLEANDLDLRILAGGSWVQGPSLHWDGQRALVRPAGRVDTSPGPVGWVLQPTTAPDTPPGGVPLTGELRGCSCQTDGPSPPGADLASVLLLPLARRRRAQTRPRLRRTSDITRL